LVLKRRPGAKELVQDNLVKWSDQGRMTP
jgi:hypothetical protein